MLSFFRRRSPRPLASPHDADLFNDEFRRKLEYLAIVSRKVVPGKVRGERRTKRSGSGLEFVDHRDYVEGDDPRFLDWSVYQRFGKLQVRLYEEEEDLIVHFLLDTSTSMAFGASEKLRYAKRLTAALAYVALANLDRVSLTTLNDEVGLTLPPTRGKHRALTVFEFLRSLQPRGTTHLAPAIKTFVARNKRRGLAVLVSDGYDPDGFEQAINVLRYHRFEPLVLHVLDDRDARLTQIGDLCFYDCETGEEREVTVTPTVLQKYAQAYQSYLHSIEQFCVSKQIPYIAAHVGVPFEETVLRIFRRGGFLRLHLFLSEKK